MDNRISKVAAFLLLASFNCQAIELGYSVFGTDGGSAFETGRGFELRLNFGGDSDRYSGDRFSIQCGYVKERESRTGWVGSIQTDKNPSYGFCAITHRWYMKPPRFAPRVRFFAGTGLARRDVKVCSDDDCLNGDYFIGSQYAFAQSLGMKWREHVEVAFDHMSTGRLSYPNKGENFFRFTLLGVFK